MCSNRRWITNYQPFTAPREVRLGGSRTLNAQGSGDAKVTFMCEGKTITVQLRDMLFVPRLRRNLLSMSQLADDGFEIRIKKDVIELTQGRLTLTAERRNGLYMLEPKDPVEGNTAEGTERGTIVKKISLAAAHRIFAHVNVETLRKMIIRSGNQVINDFKGCRACILGKMHRASFKPRPPSSIPNRLGWISSDLCAVSTPSYGQHRYFLTLTDHYSRFRKIYFLKNKDDTYGCL